MAYANLFAASPENVCPARVKKLRTKLLKHVERKKGDDELFCLREYDRFTSVLPPFRSFPAEFGQLLRDALVDVDMKEDLQQRGIINWCTSTKTLYPVKTTADGNCLLHAVAQYVLGIDDRELFLRRLLYVTLSSDTRGRFKKRWLLHQRTGQQNTDVRLDTETYGVEWDSILKATEDTIQGGNNPLPYCTLESVHLYLIANIFRRPVLVLADKVARTVFGESVQENHLGGIYLPLEWDPSHCHKQPILIGYNMNHFAPLLMEDGNQNGREQVVPLVTKDLVQFEVKYMLPEEEARCAGLLQAYLDMTEVGHDAMGVIPAVKAMHKPLSDKYNMIDIFIKDCERRFRQMMDQELGIQNPEPSNIQIQPFQFKTQEKRSNEYVVMGNNILPSGGINIVGNKFVTAKPISKTVNSSKPNASRANPKKCLTMGCNMFGNPEMSFLCSKCFNDFTIQYNRQEEMSRRQKIKSTAAGGQATPYQYHDLSMMGEDCKCGFKCSTETYPYCHECFPGPNKEKKAKATIRPPTEEPARIDFSFLPDRCHAPDCTFNCSKATFPYCHQCYEIYTPNPQVPTAPPASIPMDVDPADPLVNSQLQLRIQPQDTQITKKVAVQIGAASQAKMAITSPQTEPMIVGKASGELGKKCKSKDCYYNAIKGNDGLCDKCYQNIMFGSGNSPSSPPDQIVLADLEKLNKPGCKNQCISPNCTEEIANPSIHQCLQCFLRGDATAPMETAETPKPNLGFNISSPERKEEKVLNSTQSGQRSSSLPHTSLHVSGPPLTGSLGVQEGQTNLVVNQEPAVHRLPLVAPVGHPGSQEAAGSTVEYRKYLCSTPGCTGIRLDSGYCHSCYKKFGNVGIEDEPGQKSWMGAPVTCPSGEGDDSSQLEVSCTPVILTEQQQQELNPIITSSKQKVKCASPLCNEMIYPPKKLCEKCSKILEEHQASEALKANKQSVQGAGVKCPTPGCQFYGTAETGNFCSSCYKSGASRRTVPIQAKVLVGTPSKHKTAPLTAWPKASSKLCVEPGCSRFGDPTQADRCSQHYQDAMAFYKPGTSDESIERYRNGPRHETPIRPGKGTQHATTIRPQSVPVMGPAQTGHEASADLKYTVAMSRVESSRKSLKLCNNNATRGCTNYGNSQKKGYCNTCFPEIQKLENLHRPPVAGENQFG